MVSLLMEIVCAGAGKENVEREMEPFTIMGLSEDGLEEPLRAVNIQPTPTHFISAHHTSAVQVSPHGLGARRTPETQRG